MKTQERLRGERLVGLSHSVAAKAFRRSRGSSASTEDPRLASPKVSSGDGYALSSGRDGREGVLDRARTREWTLGKLTYEREHRWLPFDPSWFKGWWARQSPSVRYDEIAFASCSARLTLSGSASMKSDDRASMIAMAGTFVAERTGCLDGARSNRSAN